MELEISRMHDAYDRGGECPMCFVMTLAEDTYVRSFHGGRVMAPEVRVRTNKRGFCPAHLERLYRGEGKLGLGLLVHTYLETSLPGLKDRITEAVRQSGERGKKASGSLERLAQALKDTVESCFICDMLAEDLDRYCYTVLHLWKKEATFPPRLKTSRGFCLTHYAALLRKADGCLTPAERHRWMEDTAPLVVGALERLEREVLAFTKRYHHGSERAGVETEERTALSRAVQKLAGREVRLERGIGPEVDHEQDHLNPA